MYVSGGYICFLTISGRTRHQYHNISTFFRDVIKSFTGESLHQVQIHNHSKQFISWEDSKLQKLEILGAMLAWLVAKFKKSSFEGTTYSFWKVNSKVNGNCSTKAGPN